MIMRNGDLFTTDAKILGHGVNVAGVMGKGIAKTFRERYPVNYEDYRVECSLGNLKPGSLCGRVEGDKLILNFASQNHPGPNARYDWLFSSLYTGAELVADYHTERWGTTIAIPLIGCGIGGLKWRAVAKIIMAVEAAVDNKVEFEVWNYVKEDE